VIDKSFEGEFRVVREQPKTLDPGEVRGVRCRGWYGTNEE
jgi:hypothetical protein